ncbi:MAG: class I SAM-dependent methyltransferase, partial [Gemmatimonadota bacterium]
MTNTYSARWFDTFLAPVPEERTRAEIAFLRRHLPPERYGSILDVACGPGRHALALAEAGYAVTGVDVDRPSLET